MKVLVTGADGQLGQTLLENKNTSYELIGLNKTQLNLLDHEKCEKKILDIRPDWIINAAAFTAVDDAENNRIKAYSINATAVETLAKTISSYGGRLIHISTDFVFDGKKKKPYSTYDYCNPVNVYGASKLKGEHLALRYPGTIVLRTSWLYSTKGKNFCSKMIDLMNKFSKTKQSICVVNDQLGSPTNAIELSRICWKIIDKNINLDPKKSILHWCNKGIISWYDFAMSIKKYGKYYGLINKLPLIKPIRSCEYKFIAKRPMFSALDCTTTVESLKVIQINWEDALEITLKGIAQRKQDL